MHANKRLSLLGRISCAIMLLITCCGLLSCSRVVTTDPNQLLEQSLQQYESSGRVFEWQSSGEVMLNSSQPSWNPLMDVAEFRNQVESVTLDSGDSDFKSAVLDVKLKTDSAKQLLTEQLLAELEAMRQHYTVLVDANDNSSPMREELDSRLRQAQIQLEQTIAQLDASSIVRLWVDRKSKMPTRMQVDTHVSYKDGTGREEQLSESYRIS